MAKREPVTFKVVAEKFGKTPINEYPELERLIANIIVNHVEVRRKLAIDKLTQSIDK